MCFLFAELFIFKTFYTTFVYNLFMKFLRTINKIKYFLLFLIFGLGLFTYPMFLSGFDKLAGDYGDSRLVVYLLEHYFYWFQNVEPHTQLWNVPMLYPHVNTLAYSDVFLGIAIFYVPLRFLINDPFLVTQIIYIISCALNFVAFYLILNKIIKFKDLASACGAFVFAFSLTRSVQVNHLQLMLQFFSIFALFFLFKVNLNNSKFMNYKYYIIAGVLLSLQFWTAIYFGYFTCLGLFLGCTICLCFKNSREILVNYFKNFYGEIIFGLIVFFILTLPLLIHYHMVGSSFDKETLIALLAEFPHWISSFSFVDFPIVHNFIPANSDKMLGCGILTTIFAFVGIYKLKNYRWQIFSFIALIVVCFSVKEIYLFLTHILVGLGALRMSSRVVFIVLPLIALGFGYLIETWKWNKLVLMGVILLFLAEQIPTNARFDLSKTEHYKRINGYQISGRCESFYFYYRNKTNGEFNTDYEIDAMWLGLLNGIRTYNGYSGYMPETFDLRGLDPQCLIIAK